MLNEERIRLMTRMASYEQNEGKRNTNIGNYFRGDYILIQVIKPVISATIAFGIVFALYVFYNFESFMADIYKMDLMEFAGRVFKYYGYTVVIYGVLSYIGFSYRYAKTKNSLKTYYKNLKKLNSLYGNQAKK